MMMSTACLVCAWIVAFRPGQRSYLVGPDVDWQTVAVFYVGCAAVMVWITIKEIRELRDKARREKGPDPRDPHQA